MRISPLNTINCAPIFNSRHRIDQDGLGKLYGTDFFHSEDITPLDKSLLIQRFDFQKAKNDGVNYENKTYDSFTGLRDKNYLLASLNYAIKNAHMNNKALSVAMFDMDDFKSVNELLGYETGDIFIKEIAKDMIDISKEYGVDVYRFGGEEFFIIFDDESDSKKKEIVQSITQRAITNPTIQSYKNIYMRNAQSRLDKSLYLTAKVRQISLLKSREETLEEVRENLATEEAKQDPYLTSIIDETTSKINSTYLTLINECLYKETDEKAICVLEHSKIKLLSGEKLSQPSQKTLDEYLYSVYDKSNEIYQTKKWMFDFNENGGFGITCGVVNFEPESLEFRKPMEIVEKTGEVLKKGKNIRKGRIYSEDIRM